MPNVGQILKANNKKVLNVDRANDQDKPCNCRNNTNCPIRGKCQTKSIIYKADLKLEDGNVYSYIGSSTPLPSLQTGVKTVKTVKSLKPVYY